MIGRNAKISIGLKWRITLVISLLLIISCTALSVFLISEFSSAAVKALEQRGTSLAKYLAHTAEFGVMLEITPELDDLLEGLLKEEDILYAQVFDVNGRLLSQARGTGVDSSSIPTLDSYISSNDGTFLVPNDVTLNRYVLSDGTDMINVFSPVLTVKAEVSKEELGSTAGLVQKSQAKTEVIGFACVGINLEGTYNKVKNTARLIVIFTFILVVIGIILSITLAKVISKPINRLVEATELIAAGDLSQRVEVTADQEVARLAVAFNKMCDSLEQTQKEIQFYNLTLEEKIRERTQRLEEVQQQVIQSEKMAAVGQLAAGVAHELNNPLGGVLGYAQFALERISGGNLKDKDYNDFRRYLTDIEQQARRCKMIVKNLLKFSRATDKTEFKHFDINAALEETFLFVSHQLDIKNIKLIRSLETDLPQVYGNSNLLQQVFTNMMINSMQSMPDGGDLIVKTKYSPSTEESDELVMIVFQDNGVGIPEEELTKIFEPFFTTKKVGEGTGLGLSVSYGIVKEHGGQIGVESIVGEGSTFIIVLPIVKETVKV